MIDEMLDSVITKKDFVDFLYELKKDLLLCPNEWENVTLDSFLEGIAAWTSSIENYSINTGDTEVLDASWKTFAKILYAGKFYE